MQTRGGRLLWLEGSVNTRFEGGEPAATRGIFRDITERRRRTEELRASEEQLRFLADHMPVGLFQTDAAGDCRFVNQRWCDLTGLTEEEARGQGWVEALHPEDLERVRREWYESAASGREFACELRFQTPDGRSRWLFSRSRPVLGPDGEIEAHLGTVVDIDEVKRLRQAIEHSERKHRHLVESSLGLICAHDLEGRILAANPAGASALGATPEELEGRLIQEFLAPDVVEEVGEYLSRVQGREEDLGLVRVRTLRDEERIWLYRNSVFFEDGIPQYVVGHAHDVTQLKEAEEELRRLAATDDLTRLPNRRSFDRMLADRVDEAGREGCSLAILLVNLDGFEVINHRFGWLAGDSVLGEVARRLQEVDFGGLSPFWCRFGSATFAGLWSGPRATGPALGRYAMSLRRAFRAPFLGGELQLTASVGMTVGDPFILGDEAAEILARRADVALQRARLLGGDKAILWTPEVEADAAGHRDRLAGLFTANLVKDYRNTLLLWRTVMAVSGEADPPRLAREVVEGLAASLQPRRIGLFRRDGRELVLSHGWIEGKEVDRWDPGAAQAALIHEACRGEGLRTGPVPLGAPGGSGDPDPATGHAIALRSEGVEVGCLYFDGRPERLDLDEGDRRFVEALVGQLAQALHRADRRQAEQSRVRREQERLETELEELRRAVARSNLIYRSTAMEQVLASAQRVAESDATVLVGGPTGTGKEVLARTIHELSRRRGKPPVVVDLAAISPTLVESELFGHARGAFTGADQARDGRLAEAEGSTLILDEIGEMPLAVQAKLLRFVQEREVVSVGGQRVRRVDARVIAVTHRDLAEEVRQGRFREDLYYRLNVVHLVLPPLADRPEDVLALAEHFLARYGDQGLAGGKGGFTPAARQALLAHSWPGNTRELQNRVLRAVVLGQGQLVDVADLGLDPASRQAAGAATGGLGGGEALAPGAVAPGDGDARSAPAEGLPATPVRGREALPAPDQGLRGEEALEEAIAASVEAVLDELLAQGSHLPLGTWVDDELILAAVELADSQRSAADHLGLAPSTLRRRHQRALGRRQAGVRPRGERWPRLAERLREWATEGAGPGAVLPDRAQAIVLAAIARQLPGRTTPAAALAGVTPPTYRRRLDQLGLSPS